MSLETKAVTTEVTFWNFNGKGEFFLRARGMGDIEYFVLVLQATMDDCYKTAGMPRVIGTVDDSLIPFKALHYQEPWQCAIHNFHSTTVCK